MRQLKGTALPDYWNIAIIRVPWKIYKQITSISNRICNTWMQFFCSRTNELELQLRMFLDRYHSPVRRYAILQIFTHREGLILKSASG
ncbi:hypothetical protein D3C73_803660 [compost metagenome]